MAGSVHFPSLQQQRATFCEKTFAGVYTRLRTPPASALSLYAQLLQKEIDFLHARGKQAALADVGAGTGLYIGALFERLRGLDTYTAIEPSAAMADEIERHLPLLKNARFIATGIPLNPPLPDQNMAWASDIAHLFENPSDLVEGLLASFSELASIIIRSNTRQTILQVDWGVHFPELLAHECARQPDLDELEQALVAAGFAIESSQVIDESVFLPLDLYLEYYTSKPFSGMRLLGRAAFKSGFSRLLAAAQGRSEVERVIHRQIIVARRSDV